MLEMYEATDKDNPNNLKNQELIGSHLFTLHQIVSTVNSLVKAELKSPVSNACGHIKIESQQKKADYGQLQCSFYLESNLGESGFVFLTISKPSNEVGKFIPVFKSECKDK